MKAEEVIETLVYIRQFHEKNDKAMRVIDGLISKEIRAVKNHQLEEELTE